MRAINAAYALLSDPVRRAAFDARHYLPRSQTSTIVVAPRPRRVPVVEVAQPPTRLQRRVDRIVALLGIALVLAVAVYAVNVIPRGEQALQTQARARPASAARPSPVTTPLAGVGQSTAGSASGAYVPERLRLDSALRNFPGTVLVAPAALEPFASLPILRSEAASQGIARYAVYYGDLTNGSATISGLIGRASFDAGAPHLPDCPPDSAYCIGPVPGQTSGPPGFELFRGTDLVVDDEAYVTHRTCCSGVFWSINWFEPRTNMSYTIDLSRSAATLFGGAAANADRAAAHAAAGLASQLVRLP
jgi:hypothetical protein